MMPLGMAAGDARTIKKIAGCNDVRQHLAELGFAVTKEVRVVNELGGDASPCGYKAKGVNQYDDQSADGGNPDWRGMSTLSFCLYRKNEDKVDAFMRRHGMNMKAPARILRAWAWRI